MLEKMLIVKADNDLQKSCASICIYLHKKHAKKKVSLFYVLKSTVVK